MNLPIAKYGDPVLRLKGRRVEKMDDRIRELAANMLETMHAANGVGLAAQQVGEALQLTVLDVLQTEDRPSTLRLNGREIELLAAMPLILLNPTIALDRETDRWQAALRTVPHCFVGPLEIAREARGVEQRLSIAMARELGLER